MTHYSNKWLLERCEQNPHVKYVFFWRHRKSADGSVTKSCFSQWYEAPFQMGEEYFFTAEHWMMAEKARLFGREDIRSQIIASPKPGAVKALGRQVTGFDQDTWNRHRVEIVIQGNTHKFSSAPNLGNFLLNTRDRVLVEASPVDNVWGIRLEQNDPRASRPAEWQGDNLLGYALMETRDRLARGL